MCYFMGRDYCDTFYVHIQTIFLCLYKQLRKDVVHLGTGSCNWSRIILLMWLPGVFISCIQLYWLKCLRKLILFPMWLMSMKFPSKISIVTFSQLLLCCYLLSQDRFHSNNKFTNDVFLAFFCNLFSSFQGNLSKLRSLAGFASGNILVHM